MSFKEEGTPTAVRAKDEDDSHVVLIQTVLDRAMRKDCLGRTSTKLMFPISWGRGVIQYAMS